MGNLRVHAISRLSLGIALTGLLLACGKDATGPASDPVITEADVTGTWRTTVPVQSFFIKVSMVIGADHSLKFSQKFAGMIAGAPDSVVDRAYETGTWTMSGALIKSTKVVCQYAVAPDYQLKDGDCDAPIISDYQIGLKGNTMTVIDGTATYIFTRD